MKENRYDDDDFFSSYALMERSMKGLDGAAEWESLEKLFPSLGGKDVLDLGCGYGWHAKYMAEKGARSVLATDISEKMLERAMETNNDERVEYRNVAMEDLDLPPASFDFVLSSLAMHYVEDYEGMVGKIHSALRKGGTFLLSVEHPLFTAGGSEEWICDESGKILHFPVDNYFVEGKRDSIFLGKHIGKYHRTLTTYVSVPLSLGFMLNALVEPMPPERFLPDLKDELRRPMMLFLSFRKT